MTELAKALAGNTSSMMKCQWSEIDMSEYQERHSVSRLVGAPPGLMVGVMMKVTTDRKAVRRQTTSVGPFG